MQSYIPEMPLQSPVVQSRPLSARSVPIQLQTIHTNASIEFQNLRNAPNTPNHNPQNIPSTPYPQVVSNPPEHMGSFSSFQIASGDSHGLNMPILETNNVKTKRRCKVNGCPDPPNCKGRGGHDNNLRDNNL